MPEAVVVGASIAGLYTGWRLAEAGWHVRIIERRPTVGLPVRCGEATGNRREIERFIPVDDRWVARDITGLTVHTGTGAQVTRRIDDVAVILRRDLFEQDLAARAAAAGASIELGRTAIGLTRQSPTKSLVALDSHESIPADMVIGADGAESRIGRWAGLCRALELEQACSAVQYRVTTPFCDDGMMHFFIGRTVVPRGYIWVFPRDDGQMSVGACTYGPAPEDRGVLSILHEFLDSHMPGAPRRELISGCAPVCVCPKVIARGTIALVGDAARQVNPLTAGGIMNTLEAADLLVRCIRDSHDDVSGALARYSRDWRRRTRLEQSVFLLLQRVFLDCSDSRVDALLYKGQRALSGLTDRTRTFRWPVLTLAGVFITLAREAWPHRHTLAT